MGCAQSSSVGQPTTRRRRSISHLFLAFFPTAALTLLVLIGSVALGAVRPAHAEVALLTTVSASTDPESVAVDPTTNRVFVTNSGQGSVTVIDGRTHARLGDITVGGQPYGLAVHAAARKVFVSNATSNDVSIINIDQGAFGAVDGATVNVGAASRGIAVNTVTNQLYVAAPTANQVGVFSTSSYLPFAPLSIGANPEGVAVNEATNRVYVTNSGATTVTVVDVLLNNNLTSVNVGTTPLGVAVNPATNRIYVANSGSSNVSVIDAGLGNTVTAIALPGATPYGVALNPITNRIYVTRSAGGQNSISVINGFTNAVDGSPIAVGTGPRGIAANLNSGFLYVVNRSSANVSVLGLPLLTERLVTATDAGTGELRMAVNPASNRLYVTSPDAVTAFDATTLQQVAGSPITMSGSPRGVAVDSVLNRVFVALTDGGAVAVINGATNAALGNIPLGTGSAPFGAAIDSSRQLLYVTRRSPSGVTVIDTVLGTVVTTITGGVPTNPTDVALNPDTRRLYVLANNGAAVSVINSATNATLGGPIDLGGPGASSLAINTATRRLYVTRFLDGVVNVYDVNGDANALIAQVPIAGGGLALQGVAVNPLTNRIYASGGAGSNVTRIDGASQEVEGSPIIGAGLPGYLAINPGIARFYALSAVGSSGLQAFGPAFSLNRNKAPQGGSVQVTWDGLFGTNGGDRVGLYSPGAANSSPINVVYTNGTGSAGGAGVPAGDVNLTIPGGQTFGDYEVRLISGHTTQTVGALSLRVAAIPVANPDTYTFTYGSAMTAPAASGLLANDTDADTAANWLYAAVVTPPTHGSVSLQPDGAFTYTPRANFAGTDTFTYQVTDVDVQTSNQTTVTINVTPVACGPRPTVTVSTTVVNGALQATATATDINGPSQTRIQSITFGAFQNARVTMDGNTMSSGQTVHSGPNTTSLTFTIRRQTAGQATTVPFTIVDTCGVWPSFVGGGPNAGF